MELFTHIGFQILPLVSSAALSTLIALVYRQFSSEVGDRLRFSGNLIMMSLIVTLVISVIKDSLALSLGLVGALSIVRFRTPVKDPEQLIYLFLATAVGIGTGAGAISYTIIATIFITAVAGLISWHYFRKDKQGENSADSLMVRVHGNENQKNLNAGSFADFVGRKFNYRIRNSGQSMSERYLTVIFQGAPITLVENELNQFVHQRSTDGERIGYEIWDTTASAEAAG